MSAADAEVLDETELERVARWRTDELERAGYTPAAATELAFRTDIDLHLAVGLAGHGCPEELALKILL
jgi:hypothetical protein